MKPQVKVAVPLIICLIWIQQVPSGGLLSTPNIKKWTCTCFSGDQENHSLALPTNCSSSCNCTLATGGFNKWICICANDGLPKVVTDGQDTNCFRACNCSSGSSGEPGSSRKQFSGKVVVIILLLCLIITTLAFLSSVLCYISRRDKCSIQQLPFSSDKENSSTKLITHRASPSTEFKVYGSHIIPVTGWTHRVSMFFQSKTERTHGAIIHFSYSELENATNRFCDSNLIGTGGSSHVYRGHLRDGKTIAVKKIKTQGGTEDESIFATEIEVLSRLHHCNVVPLVGYCSGYQGKHTERLLVFEYMPGGNLRECLDGASGKFMEWSTRLAIALGAAKGLEYLHEAAAPRILHRDVKSTNILLDENWTAKITDLGMAKRLRSDGIASCSSSPARIQGTFGYFAPEYANVGRASLKSDVFSFGVVLLELITGRQAIYKSTSGADESLVIWATPLLKDSRKVILELPDPHFNRKFPREEMQIMAYLAKECLLLDPDSRPTMSEVVQILSTIAPEKSRRRNFALNISQSSYSHCGKSEPEIERPGKRVQDPCDDEDLRQMASERLSVQCLLPFDIDHPTCLKQNGKEADSAAGNVEKSIVLITNAENWGFQHDEAVDLTEPRFESFHMENVGPLYNCNNLGGEGTNHKW